MEQDIERRNLRRAPLATALVLGVVLTAGEWPVADDARADCGDLHEMAGSGLAQTDAQVPPAPPAAGSGMQIHIDPQTGRFTPPPPGAPPLVGTPAPTAATSTSDAGLVERPSPTPGGGIMLDLQGRFQHPLVGTVGPDGKVRIEHQHPVTGSGTTP
jgi:hypothetical protein